LGSIESTKWEGVSCSIVKTEEARVIWGRKGGFFHDFVLLPVK
jgi:hypothetical protein